MLDSIKNSWQLHLEGNDVVLNTPRDYCFGRRLVYHATGFIRRKPG